MLPLIYQKLQDSDVAALVDTRIYRHGEAPEAVVAPYVTWFVVSSAPANCLEGTPPIDEYAVQVDCWSANDGAGDTGVETLAQAVRDALEATMHMNAIVANGKDPETKRYRIGMTFTAWHHRA